MKVLHFILGKANKQRANGVNQVVAGLAKYCGRLGAEVRVIGKAESVAHQGEIIPRDGFSVEAFSCWGRPLRAALERDIGWADIVHLHGVYAPWNILVARMCLGLGRPYVVTLHDGLSPVRSQGITGAKKALFDVLVQRHFLAKASGIHVLTEEESTDLLALASPKRIFCIPNGIDTEDFCIDRPLQPRVSSRLSIGYLGRLSPEKNLQALCEAFSRVNTAGSLSLKLAGPPTRFGDSLLKRYSGVGVEGVGAKFGPLKAEFIQSLDLYVHPSLCDVFSISAMEALALGTPLLITRSSSASYFFDRHAFFMCEPSVFGLSRGIFQALDHREEWPTRSLQGRHLVADQFNWKVASRELLAAYDDLLRDPP